MYSGRSMAYDIAVKSNIQKRKLRITIDGEILTEKDFINGSPKIKMSALAGNALEFGGVVSKSFSGVLENKNRKYNGTRFNGKEVTVEAGLELTNGTIEYIPCGTFYINYAGKPYSTIKIEAADKILNAEKTYSSSTLSYPASLEQIAKDCASKMGISLLGSFKNSNYIVNTKPDVKLYTYRDILSFIASIAGGFARITRDNKLEIVSLIDNISNPYEIRPTDARINCTTDDMVTITGIAYYGNNENVLKGTDDYPIVLENNPLLEGMTASDREAILNRLFNDYNGFTYWPYSSSFVGNPCLDEGDFVKFYDTIDGDVISFVGSYTLKLTGTESIEAPSCSELDKNFLDANTYKKDTSSTRLNYAYNNGGGGYSKTTFTHDEYADLGKPTSTYLDDTGVDLRAYFTIVPTMGGSPLGISDATTWYIVAYARSKHVEPYSNNLFYEVKTTADYNSEHQIVFESSALNSSNSRELCPNVEFKFYTYEEYNKLFKMYEENLNSVDKWPILHASTPTQMDNKSTRGTIVPIEVSSGSIVSVDPYVDVREYQLAKIFYKMFNMLGISSFSDFFKSEEDVYHFILGHRVASDQGDSTTGGTTDSGSGDNSGGGTEGGGSGDTGGTTEIPEFPEPTGFTNPLPNLVNARGSLLPTSQNAALQIIYSYDTKADKISINYDYLDYDVWINQYADFVFNLSDVVKVSNNQFKFYQQPYGDSLTSKNIYALVLTYNTSNNTISITAEFTPTGDSDLDELLASEIVLEEYTPII